MRRPWRGLGDTLILLYHRVAHPDVPDPWELCVTPERFAEHLGVLRQYAQQGLAALVSGAAPRWRRSVAVTFDDGYRDNYETALPLLERFDVPATFFLCTGPIASRTPFWSDRFESSYRGSAGQHLEVYHEWQRMPARERQAKLDEMPEASVPESAYPMRADDASAMSRHPLVTIGAHTVTHPVLAAWPVEDQRRELSDSKAELERWTGKPVQLLAYPYGGSETYSDATAAAAREAGFVCAATTQARRAKPGEDPFRLPRWTVPNLDGDAFAEAVTRFFAA